MAKQDVNIGVEGNDGTGDSIRESFKKVNENFTELYAVFGVGGQINFTTLSDTPDVLTPNTIAFVNSSGTQLQLAELASNSALGGGAVDTIAFNYSVPGKLIISSSFTKVSDDLSPTIGGPVNAAGYGIANVGISTAAANAVNASHDGVSGITIDDLVITKGYADQRYITSGLPLRIATEPTGKLHYTWQITGYVDNSIQIDNHYAVDQTLQSGGHGLDNGSNGLAVRFNVEDTNPTGLTSGTLYYIRVVSPTRLYFYTEGNKQYAITDIEADAEANKINVSGTISADDVHTMTDDSLDNALAGNFLDDVGMPRQSVVRRQGDSMTGSLFLNDHPGELSGQGAPNGPEDLQAATKFYVDNTAYSSPEVLFVSSKGDDSMKGVPPGKEGTSFTYAFKTINAAAQRADILIRSAQKAPGSYMQTLTHTSKSKNARVMAADVDAPVFEQARLLIERNRKFVQKETLGFIAYNFPNFSYDEALCERDTGLILDAIALDINRGLNANYLTRQAAERYFSSVSGRIAVTVQKTETIASLNFHKELVTKILTNDLLQQQTISDITRSAIGRVTTSGNHGWSNKNIVLFKNIGGMTEIEGTKAYIKVISVDTFELYTDADLTIPLDTSAFTGYTTGGLVGLRYQKDEDQYFDNGLKFISNATKTVPVRITTTTDHFVNDNEDVTISGVNGMTQLNNNTYKARRISDKVIDLYSSEFSNVAISTVALTTPIRIVTVSNHGLVDTNLISITQLSSITEPNQTQFYAKKINDTTIDLYSDIGLSTAVAGSSFASASFSTFGTSATSTGGFITQNALDGSAFGTYSTSVTQFTPTTGTVYNPASGLITLSIGSHQLQVGQVITIQDNSLTFTCATDNNATTHTYPRSGDPASGAQLEILARTPTTITVNVGVSSNTSVHTFVSSSTGAVLFTDGGRLTKDSDANVNAVTAIGDKFETVKTIVSDGIDAGPSVVYGSTYKIVVTNGSSSYVDQTDPNNTDALPGKVIRGKRSEAIGQIVSFTNNVTAEAGQDTFEGVVEPNPTVFQVHLLSAKDFEPEEDLEYGNIVTDKQVTIRVESGIYEEDYPIKLPANTSLKGDEFRRVIIKPKTETDSRSPRVSQSKWAQTYFYRDNEFDGMSVARGGTPFLNQEGIDQGKFGYHYLYRPEYPINLGSTVTNAGNYNTAAAIIEANKDYIVAETIQFITARFPDLVYDVEKCRRDTRLIIDSIVFDLKAGGEQRTLETQGSYHELGYTDFLTQLGDSTQETATEAAIQNISQLCNSLLSATAPTYTDAISQFTPTAGTQNAQYTPSSATYNPASGLLEITNNGHNVAVNDLITIATGGITFRCDLDSNATTHAYPRATDPAAGRPLKVSATTANTYTVNVGPSLIGNQYVHTFESATTNAVTLFKDVTNYNAGTGDMVLNIGTHNLKVGQTVKFDANSLTFTCTSDQNIRRLSHPRLRTFTPVVGDTDYNPNTGDLVIQLLAKDEYTALGGTSYDPSTGRMTLVIGTHNFQVNDYVVIDDSSITFTCTQDGNVSQHQYPRPSDPASGKALTVNEITSTTITVNVGPSAVGTQYAHTFVSATANSINKAHPLENGEKITLVPNSFTFTCATDGNSTLHTYPRVTDPAYNTKLTISAHTPESITVNVGVSSDTSTHSFVSATAGAVRISDPIYGEQVPITAVGANTITVNVGASPGAAQYDHTFFSATTNAVTFGGTYTAGGVIETPDLTLGSGEAGTSTIVGNLIDKITFVFDVNYNPPLRNDQMDVFLMGDQTIIRNVTVRGHGGFMCVLDPEGQVLVKSPYIQTASSFSKSINKKTFSGGMYVDAYVGNLPTRILSKNGNFQVNVQSPVGQGLRLRPPQLPCPFYVEGRRYQVNAIANYDGGQGTATLFLDAGSNDGAGYDESQFTSATVARDIFLQTAGNRSMLANDFTQINDLGYGLIANNAAFSEQVSTFTYYCQTAMYANNGSEIRALNCSNGYGNFGLIAEGADPNEIPDQTTLTHNMMQPIKAYTDSALTNAALDPSITVYNFATPPTSQSEFTIDHGGATGILRYKVSAVTNLSDTDNDGVVGESGDILRTGVKTATYASGTIPNLGQTTTFGQDANGLTTTNVSGSGTGLTVAVTVQSGGSSATATIIKCGTGYAGSDTFKVAGDLIGGATPANDLTFTVGTVYGSSGPVNTAGAVTSEMFNIYRLELVADDVQKDDFFGTLQATVTDNTDIAFRNNFNHVFSGVTDPPSLVTRPSTAINFDESDTTTYRSTSFATSDSLSQALPANQVLTTFEQGYNFIELAPATARMSETNNASSGKYGANAGDTRLAINKVTSGGASQFTQALRLTRDSLTQAGKQPGDGGYSGGMIFLWDGKIHQITDYNEVDVIDFGAGKNATAGQTVQQTVGSTTITATVKNTISGQSELQVINSTGAFATTADIILDPSGANTNLGTPTTVTQAEFAFIDFDDSPNVNISGVSGSGLATAIPTTGTVERLEAGLQAGSTAEITVAISLLRATGHDFTQIGTGSFNDSNYPNVILGEPVNALADFYTDADSASNSQVWERRKGRVFFVSTDQDGFFRVGKFFSVDQSTGDITFAGEIGLSNANSLGFKKGVTINEFSADDAFSDESGQAVPTERAIGNFINRALGFNVKSGAQIPSTSNRIGPGFLPLNGLSPMEGNLNLNSNNITNVGLPASGTDVTNKNYVDGNAEAFSTLGKMRDFSEETPGTNEIMVATGNKIIITDAETGGTFVAGNNLENNGGSASGTIVQVTTVNDEQFGNSKRRIVYTPVTGTFDPDNDASYTNGTATANAISNALVNNVSGPFDEYTHASEASGSDVNITVTRTSSNTEINLQYEPGSLVNADVNASAAIAQSKLAMTAASTRANAAGISQADLGLASFKASEFDSTNGWIELQTATSTSDGIDPVKLQHITTDTVLGRSAAGAGAVSAVAFSTIITEGGGLADGDFSTYNTTGGTIDVLLRDGAGSYTNKKLSDSSGADTIALRKTASTGVAAGALQAEAIILGGNDTYEVLSLNGTTLQVKTPGQATVLEAAGTSTGSLNVDVPGLINVGKPYVDTQTDTANLLVTAESNAQTNSGTPSTTVKGRAGKGFVATNWVYSKAIEAIDEGANGGTNSTGLVLGADTGFAESAANTVVVFANGAAQARVNTTGLQTDAVSSLTADTNLTLTGNGTGTVNINDTATITGKLTVSDATGIEVTVGGLYANSLTSYGTNSNLTLQGNGNGNVVVNDGFSVTGNVDIGNDATVDTVTFNARVDSNFEPDATANNRNIGHADRKWNTVYASVFEGTATSAQYADLAEKYLADADYQPGTVLVFGGEQEVTVTKYKGDRKVAGVVTTDPAYLMNSELQGENVVAIALQGRVPCKVLGKVEKGDIIVSSAIEGYGIVQNDPVVGTVIGKAVGTKDDDGRGIVEVVVGRV